MTQPRKHCTERGKVVRNSYAFTCMQEGNLHTKDDDEQKLSEVGEKFHDTGKDKHEPGRHSHRHECLINAHLRNEIEVHTAHQLS